MDKYYDKNLQIINNLDSQLNVYKDKTLKMSVLINFVNDYSAKNNISYNKDDIGMICEALEFMDVVIDYDADAASAAAEEETEEKKDMQLEGNGISYSDIELELNKMLNPDKPDFSELARTRSSAELCRLILDNPENYMKVMYAIRKQL